MSEMRNLNGASDSQSPLAVRRSHSSILEIDSWMPSAIQAISPQVDRMMRLIEGSKCIPGAERDVELALREALDNAVVHVSVIIMRLQSSNSCRCQPGNEISIVVTDQGEGFDFETILRNGITLDPDSEHGRGLQLMKAYMDDMHFERGGSEVHMRKRARTTSHS